MERIFKEKARDYFQKNILYKCKIENMYGRNYLNEIYKLFSKNNKTNNYNNNVERFVVNLLNKDIDYLKELNNLMQEIIKKQDELINNKKNQINEIKENLEKKYNQSVNLINNSFKGLQKSFQILNESMKNYFLLENKKEFKKQKDMIEKNEKNLNEIENDFNSGISELKQSIIQIKASNKNTTNINQIKNKSKTKIIEFSKNYQKEINNIQLESKNFTEPIFIDEKNLNNYNYIKKIKNCEYLSYEEIINKKKETLKNYENQLIQKHVTKKQKINDNYKCLINKCDFNLDKIKKNLEECCEKIKKKCNIIYINKKNITTIQINPIIEIFINNKNLNEKILKDFDIYIENNKKDLENELNRIIPTNNNIYTLNNSSNGNNYQKKKNDSTSNNRKMLSQPKYISNDLKNVEKGINYQELYDLKVYKGIICYPVGLENLGNTCFMNSCIQCMRHCFSFSNYILKEYQPNPSSLVGQKFKKLMKDLFSNIKITNASEFKYSIGNKISTYLSYRQNDSSHFFLHLLKTLNDEIISSSINEKNNLEDSDSSESSSESFSESEDYDNKLKTVKLNEKKKNNKNIIENESEKINKKKKEFFSENDTKLNRLFVGFLINEIYYCSHKKIQSVCSYKYLNLDIVDLKNHQKINKLEDCFKNYINDNYSDENDQIYCSKCRRKVKGISKIKIVDFPEILVINLSRVNENKYYDHYVDYPINLDLSKYIYGNKPNYSTKYTLKSIIQHYGNDKGGHKIAICKNFSNNRWYNFSDSSVNEIDETKIFSYKSHMFFYERCDKFTYHEPTHNFAEKT